MSFDERLIINEENRSNIIYDEHLVRYQLAAQIAAGKNILDIACGSGYGSKILAEAGALKVTGVDRDAEALEAAKKNYSADNLIFQVGDAEGNELRPSPFDFAQGRPSSQPTPSARRGHPSPSTDSTSSLRASSGLAEEGNILADKSFNLITSFETIEHLNNPEKYLAEIARVLQSDGIFLVSTPNREVFGQKNPYHLHEFTRTEFEETLKKYFKNIFIMEQVNGVASLIKAGNTGKILFSETAVKPLYFIAVCSNNNADLSGLFKNSVASINMSALEKIRNNPAVKLVDKIYSIAIKIPVVKNFLNFKFTILK
jgi:Methylase involved in ubiquinone/menaquinone biosynthesis